ncbi:hypothetical protein VMCG_03878 [Cytospora schulzeri]|uniref:Protein-tyrosine-phosphatase n=1 Tax=Cytospora schulzeri TaxID=448051 RepID=A0A423WVG3_9PEZI|nr:hypothetical protein VMCG_03878 [Valsa malicola]
MDRLRSGFRKTRKDTPSQPTIVTDSPRRSGKTTPESASLPPQSPQVPGKEKKPSPFRSLRELSRSHKRARSPPAGSITHSPIGAAYTFEGLDGSAERPASSPLLRRDSQRTTGASQGTTGTTGTADSQLLRDNNSNSNGDGAREKQHPVPKMPSFLTLSSQEVEAKFQEIVWMERNRMLQSVTNPSPDLKWARVTGDNIKKLDRYMNIQPWQNNRVKLKVPPGKLDYINASPITLTSISPQQTTTRARSEEQGQDGTIVGLSDLAGGGPDQYIAMQGPKMKTADHVWRMVVEQLESPGVIVMLTETHEANMEKCYPYFPRGPEDPPLEVNRKDEFGDGFRATVRCEAIEETEAGEAIELRKLVVRVYKEPRKGTGVNGNSDGEKAPRPDIPVDENGDVKMLSPLKTPLEDVLANDAANADDDNNDGSATVELGQPLDGVQPSAPPLPSPAESPGDDHYEERTVWHFLYKKWPDFGVPALEDLDSFFKLMRLSRDKNARPENPRIVHCSAGVGRSGTFIALEHLIRELDAGVLEGWDSPGHFRRRRGSGGGEDDVDGGGDDGDGDGDAVSAEGQNGNGLGEDAAEANKMDVEQQLQQQQTQDAAVEVEGDDLIFHTVNQLREQRRHMVQADSQYLFIYQVMRKLWEDKYGPVAADDNGTSAAATAAAAAQQQQHVTDADYMGNNGAPAAKRLEVDPFVEE